MHVAIAYLVLFHPCRFESLLSLGKRLVPSSPSSPEVKERMKQLSQERAAVKEAWENRNEILKQCTNLQVIYFISCFLNRSKECTYLHYMLCFCIEHICKKNKKINK